eukprot:479441-Rhodomonas_salina.1
MIRQLWLDHNALETLPPSIGYDKPHAGHGPLRAMFGADGLVVAAARRCVTLEELNLDHNNLKSLPMSICQLSLEGRDSETKRERLTGRQADTHTHTHIVVLMSGPALHRVG